MLQIENSSCHSMFDRGGEVSVATITHPAAPIDVAVLRAEFPVLERCINGHPLAYLDSAATTLKPRSVLDALDRYNRASTANVHRGVYTLAEEATALYEGARER